MVQILLDVECNLQDADLRTALMHAAMNGHVSVVKALAEHERDVVDADCCTALQLAKQYGQQDVAEFLGGSTVLT